MSTANAFISDVLATAKSASAQTGVLVSVILAQWADETGWGSSLAWLEGNNYAGVTIPGSALITGVTAFPNRPAGLASYISNLNSSLYTTVRDARTWESQAKALGTSPWASGHYVGYAPFNFPGGALVAIIETRVLTQYDGGVGGSAAGGPFGTGSVTGKATGPTGFAAAQAAFRKAYGTVAPIPKGLGSTASTGDIIINGSTLADIVGESIVTVQLNLSITKSSSLTLTIHDPTRRVVKNPVFSEQATCTFGTHTYVLFGVEKEGSVLTCTFIPSVVYELQNGDGATGAFTVHPGQMTRTDFARLLVSQIEGATFTQATEAWLSSITGSGYAHTTKEQLSRGTVDNPLENSWTCLQRLASEIQWVCFECFGDVYFGPYAWLAQQAPVYYPHEFQAGITTITGTYTTGQPTGEITITCVADSWTPLPGQCIRIETLGPFNGTWVVSEITREDIEEATLTVTLMQPQPGLPEPTSGGTNPAVGAGAGNVQTTGGRKDAQAALAFCISKIGHPYSETVNLRLGPTYYDCSGLVYEAYLSVGINIGTTTFTQWPNGAGEHVPAGISNLLPGDLLYFGNAPYSANETAQHVAMVVTVTKKHGRVKVVEAADPAQGVITTSDVNPTIGAYYGTLVYLGAMRPAP